MQSWILNWLAVLPLFVLLTACGERPGAREALSAAAFLPVDAGLRWTYRVRGNGASWDVAFERKGGDVRDRAGVQVPYLFLYGVPGDTGEERAKSIYAAPEGGLEEFHLDGYGVSIQHDPPVPLLPVARVGATWTWTGTLGLNGDKVVCTASLRVEAREPLTLAGQAFDTLRVVERAEPGAVVVTRWFAKNRGMVKMQVESDTHTFGLELTASTTPR